MFFARLPLGSTGGDPAARVRGERRSLLTDDGTRVVAEHLLPRPEAADPDLAVVLTHGFTMSSQHPTVRRVADLLSRSVAVVLLDMRGHGQSGGQSTLGWREVLDVDAAVRWARILGYDRVATLGFSLGSAVVLRQAALLGHVDAVVAVSGPAQWYYRGTRPMRVLHHAVLTSVGRAFLRTVRRTTISPRGWTPPYPLNPAEAAARIAAPLLVIHGERDRYFPVGHAMRLHEVAQPPKELWILPEFGHAEFAVDTGLAHRIAEWLSRTTDHDRTVPAPFAGDGLSPSRLNPPRIVDEDADGEAMWLR